MAKRNPESITQMSKHWTVIVEEDPTDPESLILPLPEDLLAEAGLVEGDTLVWTIEDSRVLLTKK